MAITLSVPKVYEILKHFKDRCRSKGWKTSEHEDWVKIGSKYHNFIWIRMIRPSTFEKVATRHRCSIREGVSYRVVDVSYTAWLFPQALPAKMMQMVMEKLQLSERTAIYDLSWMYKGKPICLKLNETDSTVFQEFERFLNIEYKIELRPIYKLPPLPPESIPTQPVELSH